MCVDTNVLDVFDWVNTQDRDVVRVCALQFLELSLKFCFVCLLSSLESLLQGRLLLLQ